MKMGDFESDYIYIYIYIFEAIYMYLMMQVVEPMVFSPVREEERPSATLV
jgi:hypothetical protein